jgi:hypothetical protein
VCGLRGLAELNVRRQAVIKAFLRQALDRHHLARSARKGWDSSARGCENAWPSPPP